MTFALSTRPLCDRFGVEILGVDLAGVTENHLYSDIRQAFEAHSLLLFREQRVSDDAHLRLAGLFGPVEDRYADERAADKDVEISQVTNLGANGAPVAESDLTTLNLKANMLWHTDSTFLPVPALTNIAIARVMPDAGGATEFASTRAAFADLPAARRHELRRLRLWHRYAHSRAQISAELAALPMFNKWPDQLWPAVWKNPVNAKEAIYIASHAFTVDGMDDDDGAAMIRELIEWCTRPEYVYAHHWRVGDVLIWDERATLHRGTPWPYEQPRTLSSVCSSVGDVDGLAAMLAARG
jgi:alpha-ketoglutarate-dependent 2,4-dichlorophenoxyacetate dioxygenase